MYTYKDIMNAYKEGWRIQGEIKDKEYALDVGYLNSIIDELRDENTKLCKELQYLKDVNSITHVF